jgi:hypothetical protein
MIKYSSFGETTKIPERIKRYLEDIEDLKQLLKITSKKDNDVKREIKEEIYEHQNFNN